MRYLHIDFESFSEFDIKDGGASEYARHHSTELISCFWKWRHAPKVLGWGFVPIHTGFDHTTVPISRGKNKGKPRKVKQATYRLQEFGQKSLRNMLAEAQKEDVIICAWNISFERCMWEHTGHKKYGWPSIESFGIKKWEDTMAIAKANTLPGKLKDAAKEARVANQKDDAGHKAMMRICTPIAKSAVNPYGRDYDPKKWKTVHRYCGQDVRTESDINSVLYPLKVIGPNEQAIWELDQRMNHTGVRIDQAVVQGANKIVNQTMEDNDRRLEEITDGELTAVSKAKVMSEWLTENGCLTTSVAKDIVETLLQIEFDDPRVTQVLTLRAEGAKSSVKKIPKMLAMSGSDGRARYTCQYFGTSTGRWAGRGIQLQNLAKGILLSLVYKNPEWKDVPIEWVIDLICELISFGDAKFLDCFFGNALEAVSSMLRSMIVSDPGKKLIFVDYSSIEARVLAWLAGCQRILDTFERGECVYKFQAGDIYGISNPQSMDKKDPRRQVGKQAVLGLGYNMGVDKFIMTCLKNGIEITRDFAKQVVDTYRSSNREIKNFWYAIEEAAIAAVKTPGKTTQCRGIRFCKRTKGLNCLLVQLPSKRMLVYLDAKVVKGKTPWGEEKEQLAYRGTDSTSANPAAFGWVRTYGGKLVENITQAVARDIMVDAMLRLDRQGYQMLLTVHDEIVFQTALSVLVSTIENEMKIRPDWALSCPLDAEGDEGFRYRK